MRNKGEDGPLELEQHPCQDAGRYSRALSDAGYSDHHAEADFPVSSDQQVAEHVSHVHIVL